MHILKPAYYKTNLFFDDHRLTYSSDDNLFLLYPRIEKVKRSTAGLLGGDQDTVKSTSSRKWNDKVWKAIKDGFNRLINRIVQLFKHIFGIKSDKKADTNKDTGQDIEINLSGVKIDISCKAGDPASSMTKGGKINKSPCLNKSNVCLATLKRLIRDLKSESKFLKRSVESLRFDELKKSKEIQVERKLACLRDLQTLNFEISEAFRVIAEIVKDNQLLETKGTALPKDDVKEFKNLQFEFNSIYREFKTKVYNRTHVILESFHLLQNALNSEVLKKKAPWFLRSYLSGIRFLDDNADKFNKIWLETNTKLFDSYFLDLELRNDASLKISLDPKVLKTLAGDVESLIEEKIADIKTEQCEIQFDTNDKASPQNNALGGIPNVGSSCYMNSDTQIIFGSALRHFIDKEIPKPTRPALKTGEVNKSFIERLNRYLKIDLTDWRREKKLGKAIRDFRDIYELKDPEQRKAKIYGAAKKLRQSIFESKLVGALKMKKLYSQHDAPECMLALLMALGVKFELSETTTATEVENVKSVFERDSHILELPIGKDITSFRELIENYGKKEFIDNPENSWKKDGKVYSKYSREFKISGEIPECIVIQLKRMAFDPKKFRKVKVGTAVTWDSDEVDLASIIDPELYENGESTQYTLQAYVNHHGSTPKFGHYTANVLEGNNRFHLDDGSPVAALSKQKEMKARENGYLFVFKRKKTES